MDEGSFDRLSVMVNRMRDRSTRRGVLGVVLGGVLAAGTGLLGDDAAAQRNRRNGRNRNRKNCRGYGGRCDRNKDCCNGTCRDGICWFGGGGRNCGGRRCPSGWRCCRRNGIGTCTPPTFPTCCGDFGYVTGYRCCSGSTHACPAGWDCCPGQTTGCCGPNQHCCNNGLCCPDGWDCGDITCEVFQTSDVSGQSVRTMPFIDPVPVNEADRVRLDAAQESVPKP